MTLSPDRYADNPKDAASRLSICRAQLYVEIAAGRLVARKAGRRTLIERAEQERWLAALPLKAAPA